MHRMQVIRVALCVAAFAALLDASLGDSRLPLSCKNIARDVIMNSCKGPRNKRDAEKMDTEQVIEDVTVDPSKAEKSKESKQKRQWGYMNGPLGGYGDTMQSSFHNIDFQLPGLQFSNNQGSQYEEQFASSYPSYPAMPYNPYGPYGPMRRAAMDAEETVVPLESLSPVQPGPLTKILVIRSPDVKNFLGYDLSSDELEELHKEIGGRMPRNSKDLNKKIFLNVAAKCCPNAKLCYENPSLIPCMGY